MGIHFKPTLEGIDELVRLSQTDRAKGELEKILEKPVPRAHVVAVAKLLRRVGLSQKALSLLHPIIHPGDGNTIQGSEEELAEYAASLSFVGANDEAFRILETLPAKGNPSILLFKAFSHFSRWEYAAAIPLLVEHCSLLTAGSYEKAIGEINLAAALIHEEEDYAYVRKILAALLEQTGRERFVNLKGVVFELAAQNELHHGADSASAEYLDAAEKIFSEGNSKELILVEKGRAAIELRNSALRAKGAERLNQVRRRAAEIGYWEVVRDSDRLEGLAMPSPALLQKLYLGTPYEAYRLSLRKQKSVAFTVPVEGEWVLREGGKRKAIQAEAPTAMLTKLFRTLTSDFYRPFSIPSLFERLYPDEFYHPVTSRMRVHQLITRLRGHFESESRPLRVAEQSSSYRLSATKPASVRVTLRAESPKDELVGRLLGLLGEKEFSCAEAASALGLSSSSVLRVLRGALEEGRLQKKGKGKATVYARKAA